MIEATIFRLGSCTTYGITALFTFQQPLSKFRNVNLIELKTWSGIDKQALKKSMLRWWL